MTLMTEMTPSPTPALDYDSTLIMTVEISDEKWMVAAQVPGLVPVIEALESEVAELEDRVLKDRITRGDVERIYRLRRELLQLCRTVAPTIEVCRRL